MQKELIKTRFKKSIKTYNKNAVVQLKMAKNLIKFMNKTSYNNILELGCGTGFLTNEIIKNYKFNNYYAIDIVEDCRKYISDISKRINFICEDMEKIDIAHFKPDLVVSNATIQWIENLPEYTDIIIQNIEQNGSFIFTIFGEENFKELEDFIPQKMKYFSVNELENFLKKYKNYEIKEEKIKLKFNSPKEVLHHIKNTGVNALSRVTWTKSDLINFEQNFNQNYELTYHPVYVVIKIPK